MYMRDTKPSRQNQEARRAAGRELAAFMNSIEGACVAFSLRSAARKVSAFYDARLAPAKLTIAQFSVLAHASARPAPSVAALAERLTLDPSTLSRTLKPLEDSGLLAIHPDPDNRRIRRVQLTEAGKDKLVEAGQLWMAAQREAAAIVPLATVAEVQRGMDALEP